MMMIIARNLPKSPIKKKGRKYKRIENIVLFISMEFKHPLSSLLLTFSENSIKFWQKFSEKHTLKFEAGCQNA